MKWSHIVIIIINSQLNQTLWLNYLIKYKHEARDIRSHMLNNNNHYDDDTRRIKITLDTNHIKITYSGH